MPTTLNRSLGTSALATHYVTSVMGVGVLVIPSLAWSAAGPLSLVAWAVLIVYSYPFALIFAKLSMLFPTAKGVAEFADRAFGPRFGRITAVFLLITLLVANPVLGLASGRYLLGALVPDASNRASLLVGGGIILACIALNLLGVKVSTTVQMIVLGTVTVLLVLVIALTLPKGDVSRLTPIAPDGWLSLGTALLICFFGFIGWENAAPVAEEVREPARTFPKAILYAVSGVGLLYFGMALAVAVSLPAGLGSEEGLTGFVQLLTIGIGPQIAGTGKIVAGVLMLLTTNAWCLGTSRVIFALAREGILPAKLAHVSPKSRVPVNAVMALIPGYGVAVALLVLTDSNESALIKASSAAFLLVFLVAFVSALRLIRTGAIRYVTMGVVAVTVVMLPFFGMSVAYAGIMLVVALVAEFALRRRTRPVVAVPEPIPEEDTGAR
ncbi:amino acid permease [Amycolatopsis sp. OK19-0408]|uniref:Amino acid permease n=1 Tax=Amycolatopsis iheyensis TaxID=2945988 RepID=A0A9X2SJZ6_9PSEU|nr:amino acid permease [Amycolatopsis iheyensis]MCR6482860.1 amino acid permease [Amycolatopsis iheyensis]